MQAMRFAVEEINNSTKSKPLLPEVKLGYQMYDICSAPASVLATLDLLVQQSQNLSTHMPEGNMEPNLQTVAVIGPDSSSNTFTPAALLGAYLIPEVSYSPESLIMTAKTHSSHPLCSIVDLL